MKRFFAFVLKAQKRGETKALPDFGAFETRFGAEERGVARAKEKFPETEGWKKHSAVATDVTDYVLGHMRDGNKFFALTLTAESMEHTPTYSAFGVFPEAFFAERKGLERVMRDYPVSQGYEKHRVELVDVTHDVAEHLYEVQCPGNELTTGCGCAHKHE